MSYSFLDDFVRADIAFRAEGGSLEEVFSSAWEALLRVMVEEPENLAIVETRAFRLTADRRDLLLYEFLEQAVYFKDVDALLLKVSELRITETDGRFEVEARVGGEHIDPEKHSLGVDVKAVTFYGFELTETRAGWRATVVLDT